MADAECGRSRQHAQLSWRDGDIPVSSAFDDPYFAYDDGRRETVEVFIGGNRLVERWRSGERTCVAELGFGTGLNAFATCALHAEVAAAGDTNRLSFVSFELAPIEAADMRRALSRWPDLAPLADIVLAAWPPTEPATTYMLPRCDLTVITGDARITLSAWTGRADAWFLDGFSPAKNPELWGEDLLRRVFDATTPGGTFSTYTAAGWVRRNLEAAGFAVARVKGFGRKRERLQGNRPASRSSTLTV